MEEEATCANICVFGLTTSQGSLSEPLAPSLRTRLAVIGIDLCVFS